MPALMMVDWISIASFLVLVGIEIIIYRSSPQHRDFKCACDVVRPLCVCVLTFPCPVDLAIPDELDFNQQSGRWNQHSGHAEICRD